MTIKKNEIINFLYRHPKSFIKNIIKQGGPINIFLKNHGFKEMQKEATHLKFPSIALKEEVNISINYLTGKNHWHLTAFCIYSLMNNSPNHFYKFRIFDDGSLNLDLINYFNKIPNCEVIQKREIEKNLDLKLPKIKYPNLRKLRETFFFIKKLTDVHLFDNNFKFYMDSDILFLSEPKELISWAKNPNGAFIIEDIYQSYGLNFELMKKIVANDNIPLKLNAGLYGIKGNSINFNLIEEWIEKTAHPKGIGNYFLEQAFTAMLVSFDNYFTAPKSSYIVLPNKEQVDKKIGVMHHYVDASQNLYFQKAWKLVL